MVALYRASRHAEALQVYRVAQRELSDQLGLEPSSELRELEQAILRQDPRLQAPATPSLVPAATIQDERPPPERSIVVVPTGPENAELLLALGVPLAAAAPRREIVLACIVSPDAIGPTTATLAASATAIRTRGQAIGTAAFSSPSVGADIARLAADHAADLLVIDGTQAPLDGETRVALERAPCDVAILLTAGGPPRAGPVCVPFGGTRHDWAALELGAWIARATDAPLRLMGAAADGRRNGRDASRLLADASLILQRQAHVTAEPLLAKPGRRSLIELSSAAGILIVGLSERWHEEGLGRIRGELAAAPASPTVLVRRANAADERPGTRFGWSLTGAR